MSNIDLMREGYEHYNNRDDKVVDESFAEDIDWKIAGLIEVQGREGVREFFNGIREQFAAHKIAVDDYVEDGDRLICFVTHTFTKHDGTSGNVAAVHDWRFRDGQAGSFYEVADTMAFAQIAGEVPAPARA